MAHLAAHLIHVTWHAPGLSVVRAIVAASAVPLMLMLAVAHSPATVPLGIWLTFKGFNRSAPILTAPAGRWGSADTSEAAVPTRTAAATKAAAV